MADKVVQLEDKTGDNLYPLAGGMAANSITTAMLQDGAVTGDKLGTGVATVAKSGSYTDLSNKPTIPSVSAGTITFTPASGYTTMRSSCGYAVIAGKTIVSIDVVVKGVVPGVSTATVGTLTGLPSGGPSGGVGDLHCTGAYATTGADALAPLTARAVHSSNILVVSNLRSAATYSTGSLIITGTYIF